MLIRRLIKQQFWKESVVIFSTLFEHVAGAKKLFWASSSDQDMDNPACVISCILWPPPSGHHLSSWEHLSLWEGLDRTGRASPPW